MSYPLALEPTTAIASPERAPYTLLQEGRYRVRLAREVEELRALQRLRFEVFNRELGEGLSSAWETGRDEDRFDAGCDHLLVEEVATRQPVGTYRLQTAAMAARHQGFYSDGEFELDGLGAEVLDNAVELGRACVARDHRNTRVLFMLWRGLARYVEAHRLRYLFGCASLTSQEPAEGIAVYRQLAAEGRLHPTARVTPRPGFACRTVRTVEPPELPALFRIYLRHGAWICGEPVIDREFGTLDFLVLFDVAAMNAKQYRTFFG
jgi:putative hemolysin